MYLVCIKSSTRVSLRQKVRSATRVCLCSNLDGGLLRLQIMRLSCFITRSKVDCGFN